MTPDTDDIVLRKKLEGLKEERYRVPDQMHLQVNYKSGVSMMFLISSIESFTIAHGHKPKGARVNPSCGLSLVRSVYDKDGSRVEIVADGEVEEGDLVLTGGGAE